MPQKQSAENFVKERYLGMIKNDGGTHQEYLEAVVGRLKSLGITDDDVLSAAWLHDIIDNGKTSFDELDKRFGSRVAVLVLSISKDQSLPRSMQEEQYAKQLKESPLEVKIVKLCSISANLRDLKNSSFSKTRKAKEMKKKLYYLNIIKTDLIKNKAQTPGIVGLVNGINDIVASYGLRPIVFQ
ncbi:MAG: HD domain-containing protein [Thaumarchaeota archaeon]|nr:HD domain-containing protein [Nitrososphaerota archaeon]MDE1838367.1 HD domain-containing protein [Nitrososphaerota archaeon]